MSVLVSLEFHTQAQHLTHPLASLPGSGRDTGDPGSTCLYHTSVSLFSLLKMRKVWGKVFVS